MRAWIEWDVTGIATPHSPPWTACSTSVPPLFKSPLNETLRSGASFALSAGMPQPGKAITMADWQALALQDPELAAQEIVDRCARCLSEDQRRAVFASLAPRKEIADSIKRVANTIAAFAGTPYVLKDLFYTPGVPLRAGSRFSADLLPSPPRESRLVHALKGLGAVLVGKTQLHEFAYGLTGENPHYGDCEHPRFPGRTSGGSSSGSAAAVAAGIVPLGIGTDTGGSIRVPAAFCGLYGFRDKPGGPFIQDAFPLAPSFDAPGWFTNNPQDLLSVNRFILGKPHVATRALRGISLGFSAFGENVDPDFERCVASAMESFAPLADRATHDDLRAGFSGTRDAYSVLQSAEAFAVHANWLDRCRELYDPAVWARIDRGRKWTIEQRDAAQAKRVALQLLWTNFFQSYDFLVLPATPFPALTKAECTLENRNRLLDLTAPASLAGLPVLSIPVSLPDGLSTGLQVVVNNALSPVIARVLQRGAEK